MPLDLARIDALVFDIDGTLADTDDHLVTQLAGVIENIPFVDGRQAALWAREIVMGAETPINALYEAMDRYGLDAGFSRVKDGVRSLARSVREQRQRRAGRPAEAVDEIPHDMLPDVEQMLHALAERFPMSAMSTGGEPRIRAFLEHHGVLDHFTAIAGAQTTPRMKPYPDPLLFCADAMGVQPERCLVVGDTTVDMRTARAGGAQAVGVLCGFGTEDELRATGADLILATTSDLLGVLAPAEDTLGESAEPMAEPDEDAAAQGGERAVCRGRVGD